MVLGNSNLATKKALYQTTAHGESSRNNLAVADGGDLLPSADVARVVENRPAEAWAPEGEECPAADADVYHTDGQLRDQCREGGDIVCRKERCYRWRSLPACRSWGGARSGYWIPRHRVKDLDTEPDGVVAASCLLYNPADRTLDPLGRDRP